MLAARLFARRACVSSTRQLLRCNRYISSSAALFDANPFLMPAMSPTMEKGGIVSWKFKEGDSFNAGDVLLEVETDKAQIDVEAQDDGKLAKIVYKDGSKDVSVGDVIAFTAEPEDDLSTLEIPEVADSMKKSTKSSSSESQAKSDNTETKATPEPKEQKKQMIQKNSDNAGTLSKANPEQTLLPSVIMALADNGVSKNEALEKIQASGQNGRILKGDVLAYAGKISQDSVVRIAEYVKKGEKLDLSNIEKSELTEKAESENVLKESNSKQKPAKPEPIELNEEILFEVSNNVDITKIERSIRKYIDEIYQYTHETPLTNTYSDRYDPLFEDLVTIEPRAPRFDVEYSVTQLNDVAEQEADIFDLLATKNHEKKTNNDTNVYSLEVTVTVNDKFTDSIAKSELFLESLREISL
ncbi:Pyruvate dehydrogenase complex protein X component, mitochondrial [Nakaseomyces bracarensis]|uniref:Pyruvate dehydrogenase complex protein X component, mitochondrial n=1 Tax=Nakaseomyces bracarensis TaxID=273131 RepID=A0ABR4NVW2_9SACH